MTLSQSQATMSLEAAIEEIKLRTPHSFGLTHEGNYPHAAVAALVATVTGTAPEPTIEDLTTNKTEWYSSNDDEIWQGGPYGTREEAEAGAKAQEHRLIVRATKGPIRVSRFFDQESFIEQVEEALDDVANEDGYPLLDFLPEVNLDLQARVRAAIDEWQIAHRLSPVAWRFDSSDPVEIAAWAKGGAA